MLLFVDNITDTALFFFLLKNTRIKFNENRIKVLTTAASRPSTTEKSKTCTCSFDDRTAKIFITNYTVLPNEDQLVGLGQMFCTTRSKWKTGLEKPVCTRKPFLVFEY